MDHKLECDNKLFCNLASQKPIWWENLKRNKEIYCDVRKGNYINVYYNGGSIMKLEWDGGYKATIHFKYIPLRNTDTYLPYDFDDEGISFKNPGVIDINNFDHDSLKRIKDRVKKFFPKKSEKGIQGGYVTHSLNSKNRNGFFLDSEFQYDKKRIDLVWVDLEKKQIAFVELKTRSDARLYMTTGPNSDAIDGQLKKYADFIQENRNELLKYYSRVYQIKKDLGLLKGFTRHTSLDKFTLLDKPILLVGDCTKKWIEKHAEAINERVSLYVHGAAYQGSTTFNFRIPNKSMKHYFIFPDQPKS